MDCLAVKMAWRGPMEGDMPGIGTWDTPNEDDLCDLKIHFNSK